MAHLILVTLLPLVLCIGGGYALKSSGFLQEAFWQGADRLNYYVLFPALLFLNFVQAEMDVASLERLLALMLLLLAATVAVLWWGRRLAGVPQARSGVYVQANVRFSTYIGMALAGALFAEAGLALLTVMMAVYIPLVNVVSVLSLTRHEQLRLRILVLSLLRNPLILVCLAGMAAQSAGWGLWPGIAAFLKLMAMCSLPLGLLSVGASLRLRLPRRDTAWALVHTFSRLLLMPLAAYALARGFGLPLLHMQMLVLFFALPTAPTAYTLTRALGGDAQLMANIISLQTLAAGLTLPLVLLGLLSL